MKIDLKKTVLLFVSVHLLIAWVADRQGKAKTKAINTSTIAKKAKGGGPVVKTKTGEPYKYAGFDYGLP